MPASLTCEQVEVWLEIADPASWEQPTSGWDMSSWDVTDGETPAMWEADELAGWHNATAHNRGFIIDRGRQTSWDDLQAATCEFELDNSDGTYSVYGELSHPRIRPGCGLRIYANWDGIRYPLFIGDTSEWVEGQEPGDYAIRGKATDAFRLLNDPIDLEYHAGIDREWVSPRINRLLDRGNFVGNRSIAEGHSSMTNYLSTRTLLDEIRVTAMSDGGIFFIDNDGTAMYLDRNRIYGRPRAEPMPVFGDGCNDLELPYAAIEPRVADQEFGNVITISNVSQGTDSQFSAKAVDAQSISDNGRWLWSTPQLVICNVEFLQSLANWQLERRSTVFYRVNSFECYPVHRDDLWPVLLGLRIGDMVKVIRRPPYSTPIDANMLVDGLRIEATPDLWKIIVRCSNGSIRDDIVFWDVNATWDDDVWL